MNPSRAVERLDSLPWRAGLSYGLLGLPLAFAALPLYVVLPNYYARELGLSLATVGALLMLVRLIDAAAEPLLGRLSDALYRRSVQSAIGLAGGSALLLVLGMTGLFSPQPREPAALAVWMVIGLLLSSVAHSLLVIVHQAWGIRLGGDAVQRSRIVAWREGFGLIGVVAASTLSVARGTDAMLVVFTLALLFGWLALWRAPRPQAFIALRQVSTRVRQQSTLWLPLGKPAFRRLLAVFLCNGIAGAIPAALMLFFAQDRLLASPPQIAFFLTLYFFGGALSISTWVLLVRRLGLERSWLIGMFLAVACFGWAALLEDGHIMAFGMICVLSGIALGADLVIPGALLGLLIERLDAQGSQDGAYLGWWNLATKLNLALAAGATLPLLHWLGYVPGSQDPAALQRLAWTYALLPCALKLTAAWLLHRLFIAPRANLPKATS